MSKKYKERRILSLFFLLISSFFLWMGCDPTTGGNTDSETTYKKPALGQTSFTSETPGGSNNSTNDTKSMSPQSAPSAAGNDTKSKETTSKEGAPSGREGDVEEADLYKVSGKHLFYLNTYKGFTIFDLEDLKKPKKLANLQVFGYPIEMFVEKNIVYALVKDALYLTRVNGKFQFQKRYTSQLVTIDISNPTAPKVLQRLDIQGMLHEGVSRKIDNTLYVVSYVPRYYWYGWNYGYQSKDKEEVNVYSFNVADPTNAKMVQSLDLLKDVKNEEENTDTHYMSRSFSGVTISATSNALMVGENWYYSKSKKYNANQPRDYCNDYESYQYSRVSIVDISDVTGKISIHTRFEIRGQLTDQFKQTYVYDKTSKKGTYFGIFQRQEWIRDNCSWNGQRITKNTLFSVDITDGKNPNTLAQLDFGKENETVRGSYFDVDRGVVYAITAVQRDPFYAISIKDPSKLSILSEIDGLSGDINVFRPLEGGKFLMAIGRDNSDACTGFDSDTTGWRSTQLAVSIMDVRDLSKARLVQRKCIAIKNASWVSSQINWNLDQAHKMIGMFSDAKASILTVPVNYYDKSSNGWYYEYKSAVGVMKWDLSKYDDTKDEKNQTVLENVGTILHPKGYVKRTIVTQMKQAGVDKRVVLNLSDTHLSFVDLDDVNKPEILSTYELAPYLATVFQFGDYAVEQVNLGSGYDGYNEFRVKKPVKGSDISEQPILASIQMGQISQVLRWKSNLILLRRVAKEEKGEKGEVYFSYDYEKTEVVVLDLADPTKPVLRGKVTLSSNFYPNYYFYCGGYWGYNFSSVRDWISVDNGIVRFSNQYDYQSDYRGYTYTQQLLFLNFSNLDQPTQRTEKLHSYSYTYNGNYSVDTLYNGIVGLDDKTFFLNFKKKSGERTENEQKITIYKNYAQRWQQKADGTWAKGDEINVPGDVIHAYKTDKGKTRFLAQDSFYVYRKEQNGDQSYTTYNNYTRLFSLELVLGTSGGTLASLLDFQEYKDWYLKNLLVQDNKLFLLKQKNIYWHYWANGTSRSTASTQPEDYCDHFEVYDLSGGKMVSLATHATLTQNLTLVGLHQDKLFFTLGGDGVLVVDAKDLKALKGLHFERTLGWASTVVFFGDIAFVASGHYGIYQLDLTQGTMPL